MKTNYDFIVTNVEFIKDNLVIVASIPYILDYVTLNLVKAAPSTSSLRGKIVCVNKDYCVSAFYDFVS